MMMEVDPPHPDGRQPAGDLSRPAGLTEEQAAALRHRLIKAVAGVCPAWLADQREDIVQNALIQLIRSLKKSEGDRQFSSIYLAKAAHGATVDEIRRRCRRKENPAEKDETVEQASSDRPGPERQTSARELGRGIQNCMAQMLRPRRLAVTLHLHGCTVRESATRLQWTYKRTESLLYRGLKDLRRCLARKGMTP
jgi:RNA polymerase sigma-70 factor (ECF subfamily)